MGPWPSQYRGTTPRQEARGGDHVDWENVTAGEPLPERPEASYPEPDSMPLIGQVPEGIGYWEEGDQ